MKTLTVVALVLSSLAAFAQGRNVDVPKQCTPQVNQKLQQLIDDQPRGYVENVMACGTAVKTVVNRGGRHGSHHIITVSARLPNGRTVPIQIAINDSLDGEVSADRGATVFAYGQGYIAHGQAVAGIHDVHCSTHRAADNGWVVVNGTKTPSSCPNR